MSEERYVAAIEISSSKIIGAIGIPQEGGVLRIVAVEHEKCQNCVRLGRIQNVDETADHISRVLSKLEHKHCIEPRKITGVFIGISGRSLRNIETKVSKTLPDQSIISEETLHLMSSEAREHPIDNYLEIIDIMPRSYIVNGAETQTPVGTIGEEISAVYDIIVARQGMMKTIDRTIDKIDNIRNEGFVVTAMATAKLILTEDEKRLGCMLVDMGAETTTVTIYKDGALRYYATLPLGSRNITRDITSLSVLEDRAEEIKTTSGSAIAPESPSTLNLGGLKISDVIDIVVARSNEIVANVTMQTKYAGLRNTELPGGIILMGGGSRLKNMPELLSHQSGMKVRRATLPSFVVVEEPKIQQAEIIEVASVLYAGATLSNVNCLQMPTRAELPHDGTPNGPEEDESEKTKTKPKREPEHKSGFSKWATKWQDKISKMFIADNEEDNDNELLDE